jgi:hypothetical protein
LGELQGGWKNFLGEYIAALPVREATCAHFKLRKYYWEYLFWELAEMDSCWIIEI